MAVDSDLVTWRNFDNHYWPAHYLADSTGELRQVKFGEGGEATTEKLVRELLREATPTSSCPIRYSPTTSRPLAARALPRPTWAPPAPGMSPVS